MLRTIALLAGVVVPAVGVAQTKPAKPAVVVDPRKWEWELDGADLKPDPIYHFGACKNGLRYVWLANSHPAKVVSLRLHVDVGSLMESETELGIAHFTEHMAFNGTTNFKAGTLVDTFEKQGVKFGHDVNASTGFDETIYELDLPDADQKRLKDSLLWFRDVACGLKMEQSEIQSEKGVVDSEERDRNGEGFRALVDALTQTLDGTLYPKRLPIGVKSVRDKFNSKICLGFYKKWYRPENMTFVMVGDIGALDPTKMIEDNFGSIPVPKDPPTPRPDLGKPTFKNKVVVVKENPRASIVVAKLRPNVAEPYDTKTLGAAAPLVIAESMANKRFFDRQAKEKLPYVAMRSIQAQSSREIESFGMVAGPAIAVYTTKEKWREALTAAERELRRILERGFTADELTNAYADYDQTLVLRPKFPPPETGFYVQDLLNACNARYVPTEDKDEKDARRAGARKVREASIALKALKDEWNKGELVFVASGGLQLGADPLAELTEVWNAAKATDLDQPMAAPADATTAKADKDKPDGQNPSGADGEKKPDEKKAKKKGDASKFAYAQPDVVQTPDSVTIDRLKDLRVVTMKFKNGVVANYRARFEDEQGWGHFEVRVGEGESKLDPSRHAIAWVAEHRFMKLGLGKNEWDDVSAAGGGGVDLSVDGDALVFKGLTFGGDVKRQLEIVCAYLTDPGFRQDAWDAWKKKVEEKEEKKKDEAKKDKPDDIRTLVHKFEEQVLTGDARLVDPAQGAIDQVTLDEVKTFCQAQLDGPVAITVVGMEGNKVERALFSTVAKLPARRASQLEPSRCTIVGLKSGLREKHTVETGAASALIHMLYPSPDQTDPATARKLDLLEDVVEDRLLKEIREKKGGAYSPQAHHFASDSWRGLGWFQLDVEVDPAKVDEMTKACCTTMETLGTKGVTQEELNRLRTAHVGGIEQTLKVSEVWFDHLRYALQHPEIYSDLENWKTMYDKVTVADLNALCKTIFVKGKEDVFVATPPVPKK